MNLNNLINDNGMYLYKDNSFNTISIQLDFLSKRGNKEFATYILLNKYLLKTNKKYKSEKDINKIIRELYSMDINFSTFNVGSKDFICLAADIVSFNAINDDYSKEVFEFMHDILFNPDFTDEKMLESIKSIYLSNVKNILSDYDTIGCSLYCDKVFNDKLRKYEFSSDYNYIASVVNSVTMDDLKKAYQEIINDKNFYRGLVFGDITDEQYKLFREYIPFRSSIDSLDFYENPSINEGEIEIPKKNMNESIVYVTYKIDIPDQGILELLEGILNYGSGLCSSILREKYHLVYASNARIDFHNKTMYFYAKIEKKNKQKLLDAIDEMVAILQDKDKLREYIDFTKENLKIDQYTESESKEDLIENVDDYIYSYYDKFDKEEFIKNIDSYPDDEIIKCTKTLTKKNVFMLRGDNHE